MRFTTDRELAREQEGIELMGLDHPLMSELLQRWQDLDAEMLGVAVAGDDGPAVVSWWLIHTEGKNGEHRSLVLPLAVTAEGRREPSLERRGVDLLNQPPSSGQPSPGPAPRASARHHRAHGPA